MQFLKTPIAPANRWPVERDTQPADVNRLYRKGEAQTLAIINDTGQESTGPAGWPAAAKILQWARAAAIQTNAQSSEHTRAVAKFRRVLLVTTIPEHAAAWRVAAEFSGVRRFLPPAPASARPAGLRGVR